MIKVENVCFSYPLSSGKIEAISNLSLEIKKGSFCTVIGPNGCGKSTFAKLLNAIEKPQSGRILVNGLDSLDPNNTISIRKAVGLVFQNPDSQIVGDTVEEDVAFGPENMGLSSEEIENRVSSALESVGISNLRFCSPLKLSGGQKQKVAIAGALALGSECLVLDEATSMLDETSKNEVVACLHKLNKEKGTTVILITQDVEQCVDCDTVYVMDRGRLVLCGSPKEVFSQYTLLKSLRLRVPVVTQLAHDLGYDTFIVTKEELVKELSKRQKGNNDAQRS